VKIYVATVEALRKKERQGEIQETIKIPWFPEFLAGFLSMPPCV
jgi:hypothetical protein